MIGPETCGQIEISKSICFQELVVADHGFFKFGVTIKFHGLGIYIL